MSDEPVSGFAAKLFRACLLIFGAMLILSMAVDVLRCIWPWLVGVGLVVLVVYVGWQVWRGRRNRW
jgi:hypothetical protein